MSVLDDILARIERNRKAENEPWEGDQSYSMEKAEKNVIRKNRKADAAAPLLAYVGLVEHQTPEELKAKYDRNNVIYAKQITSCTNEMAERAKEMIRMVSKFKTEEELLELEAYRVRVYPLRIEYDLEYWKRFLDVNEVEG